MHQAPLYAPRLAIRVCGPGRSRFALRLRQRFVSSRDLNNQKYYHGTLLTTAKQTAKSAYKAVSWCHILNHDQEQKQVLVV